MPEDDILDQGGDPNPDNQDNGGGDPSGDGGDGDGGGDAGQNVKIGDKEYTPEQLAVMQENAKKYGELLPEFTIKSQRLAELEKSGQLGKQTNKDGGEEDPPYYDPNWKPKDYGELAGALKMAESRGEQKAIAHLQKIEQTRQDAEKQVDDFVTKTKGSDKEFDEKDFFSYIQRHKLPITTVESLDAIYSTYKEAREAGVKGEKDARKNMDDRKKDGVDGPKGGGGKGFSVPMNTIRRSGSAVEAASDAFQKTNK